MFTKEDFDLFLRWSGQIYDKNNEEHKKVYIELNIIYNKIKEWADLSKRQGWEIDITRSAISPSLNTKFTGYYWAKLYPTANRHLAYVVSIVDRDDFTGFVVGIDTFHVDTKTRNSYCDIRDNNHIESFLSIEEGIDKSFEELGAWAAEEFSKLSPNYNEILHSLFPTENINITLENKISNDKSMMASTDRPLNAILFGPPGTGKTYNTVNKAIDIIEPKFIKNLGQGLSDEQQRIEIKSKFDAYIKSGEIAFTTFHQSYGYEDFVEGIKVLTTDDGKLDYFIQPGIFKQICEKAFVSSSDSLQKLDLAIERLKEQLLEEPIRLKTEAHKKDFTLTYRGNSAFYAKPDAGKYDNPVSIESIKKLYINPGIQSGTDGVHFKIYTAPVIQYLITHFNLSEYLEPKNKLETPHVLIIDEINRGNISKIFGELITLIEPDKRKGSEEEISVILPYSKDSFSVPQNVHIIGTMNTADVSIAKLDVALRRRFKFTEMPPNPELLTDTKQRSGKSIAVEGVNLKDMLTVINQRIELLYDREHTIGHSFFMKLTNSSSISELAAIFEKEIIPLLQEYFFDDWERIHWVLDAYKSNSEPDENLCFVRKKKNAIGVMGERWKSDSNQSALADVWELKLKTFQKPEAYIGIYEKSKSVQVATEL